MLKQTSRFSIPIGEEWNTSRVLHIVDAVPLYNQEIWKQRDGVFIFYYGFHEGYRSDSLRNVEVTTLSSYE
ncbi:hypothetical protein MRB53_011352 [Persea americana]|uniref:Uncharacterized protein n=1 Tax=Persea americana TaxID=3435 RepID=A0ACC2LUN9_PERAE|nr:hypothetical protein MRB53_011352 [Persea americana]